MGSASTDPVRFRRVAQTVRVIGIVSSGFVALTAISGGAELVTGWPREQPPEWLDGTPFDSYVVPGLLLGGVVGGTSAVAAWGAATGSRGWPAYVGLAGVVLTGWTVTEVAVLSQPEAPTPVEWFYSGLGLVMVALGAAGSRVRDTGQGSL